MPNFSNIVITGHLGRDAELAYTGSGTAVCRFSVAVTTGYGERESVTWYNVSIFGKRGETAAEHLKKGDAVTVTGEHSAREYDKDGAKRVSQDIRAHDWTFAGSKGTSEPKAAKPQPETGADYNDPLPF